MTFCQVKYAKELRITAEGDVFNTKPEGKLTAESSRFATL